MYYERRDLALAARFDFLLDASTIAIAQYTRVLWTRLRL